MNIVTLVKNYSFLILFVISIFIIQLYSFNDIVLHHDQTFHIRWFLNLKNSDHFLSYDSITNFGNFIYDNNGFVYELLKPASNSGDYHAYLFQINSILVIYFFSFFLNFSPEKLYIFVSILFSSLSIILNYKILIIILKEYKIYQNSYLSNFTYQLIFCLISVSFYRYYFSPLGHHNIAYFFFSLTILILLNKTYFKNKKFPYIMGLTLGFVSYFQLTNVLLLLPFISYFFLLYNYEISFENLKKFIKFFLTCLIFYIPFFFLIIIDLQSDNKDFFTNLIGDNPSRIEFYLEKISFWLKKFYKFGFPVVFFSFFSSIFLTLILKKNNYIQNLIIIHFIINIILSVFYISYLRNFYYVFNIFLILCSFVLIYLYQKKIIFKLFSVILISFHLFYNLNIILNKEKLETIEPLFYRLYFEDKGKTKEKILRIKNLKKENFVFFSDFSKNYFQVYAADFVNENFLTKTPLLNISNHYKTKSNKYSNHILQKFNSINNDFHLISFTTDFNEISSVIYKLQNYNLVNKRCSIQLPHLINETIFRDAGTGEFNTKIYLTKLNC